jgi:hypothetical protein
MPARAWVTESAGSRSIEATRYLQKFFSRSQNSRVQANPGETSRAAACAQTGFEAVSGLHDRKTGGRGEQIFENLVGR